LDYLVTSTLSSQACPAVGRAMAAAMAPAESAKFVKKGFVSFVSLGDGSVNNAHFLSAVNLAEYVKNHKNFKCPVVFAVTDNGLCISLKTQGWTSKFFKSRAAGTKQFTCDARDMVAVSDTSREAIAYAREMSAPVVLLMENLPRRFGHAAPDYARQFKYRSNQEIKDSTEENPVAWACAQAVNNGAATYSELADQFEHIWRTTEKYFGKKYLELMIIITTIMYYSYYLLLSFRS
jgi:TPP-dependent pyruvate/acetoin dehydrogenase alpha subunit